MLTTLSPKLCWAAGCTWSSSQSFSGSAMPQFMVAGWLKETEPSDWTCQALGTSQPLPSSMSRIFSASPMREGFTSQEPSGARRPSVSKLVFLAGRAAPGKHGRRQRRRQGVAQQGHGTATRTDRMDEVADYRRCRVNEASIDRGQGSHAGRRRDPLRPNRRKDA